MSSNNIKNKNISNSLNTTRVSKEQAEKAIELIQYNKINAKNSFDINVGFIEDIAKLLNNKEESSWQKASASLDASAKIYGYRVDSVHSETFKFLGGLNRNEKKDKENEDEGEEKTQKEKKIHTNNNGVNTIEENHEKLNLTKYDLEVDVDPLFKAMTAKFNESGARGLLLNTLPLDGNLDILLESKKNENNNNKNDDKNNNVNNNINNNNNNVTCSTLNMDFSEDVLNYINEFTKKNTVENLLSMKLCPDLTYFRRSTEIENKDLATSFIENFKTELEKIDNINIDNNNNMEIIKEEEENLDDFNNNNINDENLSSQLSNNGVDYDDLNNNVNNNNNNLENELDEINLNNTNNNNNNTTLLNNFSLFQNNDIIEHAENFGDGSRNILKNLPQFQNFLKNFGKLEKGFFNNKLGINNNNNININKKKEEKFFDFSEENEIDKNDIWLNVKTKNKKFDINLMKKDKKKKVKLMYNFDKFAIFKFFTMPNKNILNNKNKNNNNENENNNNLNENIFNDDEINNNIININEEDDEINNSINNNNNNANNNFKNFDEEYKKNYGSLYRRFDIRFLKNKIWQSFENIENISKKKNEKIDFKTIVKNMSKDLTNETINNISTPTCFVCMLHLCNEKNLKINQNDDKTFFVDFDAKN